MRACRRPRRPPARARVKRCEGAPCLAAEEAALDAGGAAVLDEHPLDERVGDHARAVRHRARAGRTTSTERLAPAGQAKLQRPLPSQSSPVLRRSGLHLDAQRAPRPRRSGWWTAERIEAGTSRTAMRRSTSS